jgi:hypothetical protein
MFVPLGLLLLAGCQWGNGFPWASDQAACTPGSALSPTPINRVLLDVANDRACVANRNAGIDAVRLRDGQRLWSSTQAQRPLLACRDGIVCLRRGGLATELAPNSEPSIVLLNASTGTAIWVAESLGVPSVAPGWEGHGCSFTCTAELKGAELVCLWKSTWAYVGGAQPPPGMVLGGEYAGQVRIDFQTGRILGRKRLTPDEAKHVESTDSSAVAVGERSYRVAQEQTTADKPAIGQYEYLRYLEAWDRTANRRLWRYPVLGEAGYLPMP